MLLLASGCRVLSVTNPGSYQETFPGSYVWMRPSSDGIPVVNTTAEPVRVRVTVLNCPDLPEVSVGIGGQSLVTGIEAMRPKALLCDGDPSGVLQSYDFSMMAMVDHWVQPGETFALRATVDRNDDLGASIVFDAHGIDADGDIVVDFTA